MGSRGEVSFEEEGTVDAKTQRPETTQGCHGNASSSGGVQGSICGAGEWGEPKMRLKRDAAEVISVAMGSSRKIFSRGKVFSSDLLL